MTAPPIFILCSEASQINELKSYLTTLGVSSLSKTPATESNWSAEFIKCIPMLNVCFEKDDMRNEELGELLTTVASLILQLPVDHLITASESLCDLYLKNLEKSSEKVVYALYSLDVLFLGVPSISRAKYRIYTTILECARKIGAVNQVITDTRKVTKWLQECGCSDDDCRELWRRLYETHSECNDNKRAIEAMIHLLNTFTEETASRARADAIKCILSVIQDPNMLAHDQLLTLKPIQFLEGEPIHDLLLLFVSSDLEGFNSFVKKHPRFLVENKLSDKSCLSKLRVLSFMQMCENVSELDYESVSDTLKLEPGQVESFVIDVVRQRVVACKLDQMTKKISIVGTLPRSFGLEQWKSLYENLLQWQTGLVQVNESLNAMLKVEAAE